EALEGVLDVGQLGFYLLEDREVLLPLEGLGADVGLVLVDRRQLADGLVLGLVGDVLVVEAGLQFLNARPLRLEPPPGLVRIHPAEPTGRLIEGLWCYFPTQKLIGTSLPHVQIGAASAGRQNGPSRTASGTRTRTTRRLIVLSLLRRQLHSG